MDQRHLKIFTKKLKVRIVLQGARLVPRVLFLTIFRFLCFIVEFLFQLQKIFAIPSGQFLVLFMAVLRYCLVQSCLSVSTFKDVQRQPHYGICLLTGYLCVRLALEHDETLNLLFSWHSSREFFPFPILVKEKKSHCLSLKKWDSGCFSISGQRSGSSNSVFFCAIFLLLLIQ